jgi:energy-converting hydrogenase Eha subunit C
VVNILRGSTFVDGWATWTDNVDGSGTIVSATSGSVNTSVLWSYTLTYSHTDVAGNTGSITRSVNVVTGNIPVITLIGSGTIMVPFGSGYTDVGATASDVEDGNLTSSIVVNNTVNTGAIGLYTVTYDVTDAQTNQQYEYRLM